MTKGTSEGTVRTSLAHTGLAMFVYKPPDDARNWKPCDFMVWIRAGHNNWGVWLEVKDTPTVRGFPVADLRPSQLNGIRSARQAGIPYYLVVHWSRTKDWTISDATRVLDWIAREEEEGRHPTSVPRDLMQTRFGVHTEGRLLASTLKLALLGEM